MVLEFISENPIVYVLIAWVVTIVLAKACGLDRHGFSLKPYSLVYRNESVNDILERLLSRTRRAVRIFADVSVVAGFAMMAFAFYFLAANVTAYFDAPTEFAEVTVLIPGVTLTSGPAIAFFLLSIPIVLIMHEGAHGIVAALERIRIKNGGFAVFIALFAGFVEPDEKAFESARRLSRLRVIGAGATANVAFSMVLGALLLTNPVFAIVLPDPLVDAFYETPGGVGVLSVMEGLGAERAGILAGDKIVGVNGLEIASFVDLSRAGLEPGDTADLRILRGGEEISMEVEIMPSPNDPSVGLVGIMRDNTAAFKPIHDYIAWDNPSVSMFLLWLWMISFFIGIINMLPLPILDGGKFVHILLSARLSEARLNVAMWVIYGVTFALFALNIGLSYAKSGWFTI